MNPSPYEPLQVFFCLAVQWLVIRAWLLDIRILQLSRYLFGGLMHRRIAHFDIQTTRFSMLSNLLLSTCVYRMCTPIIKKGLLDEIS